MKRLFFLMMALLTCGMGMCDDDLITFPGAIAVDDVTITPGGTAKVIVRLAQLPADGTDLNGAQFDMILPEGVTIYSRVQNDVTIYAVRMSSDQDYYDDMFDQNMSYFSVGVDMIENNRYRFIISNSNNFLPLKVGGLIEITLKNVDNFQAYNYAVSVCGDENSNSILISGVDDTYYGQEPLSFNVTIPMDENKEKGYDAFKPYTGKVIVKRTISQGNWNTICLPFSMTGDQLKEVFGNDVQLAEFSGCESHRKNGMVTGLSLRFASANTLSANKPYLIKVSNAINEPFQLAKTSVVDATPITTVSDNSFVGTYKYISGLGSTSHPYLFLSGNKFYTAVGNTDFKPFRAYFDLADLKEYRENSTSEANINFFVDDDQVTEIVGVTMSQEDVDAVYDLQGRKVKVEGNDLKSLQKGVYIINGKKVTVK